jgi:hypothetical protein
MERGTPSTAAADTKISMHCAWMARWLSDGSFVTWGDSVDRMGYDLAM